MEVREYGGGTYPDRHCRACGVGLMESERCTIPGCPENRGRRRTLTGAQAAAQLTSGTLDGRAAVRLLDADAELEERALDAERIDQDMQLHDLRMRRGTSHYSHEFR